MGIDHSNPYIHSTTILCDGVLAIVDSCIIEGIYILFNSSPPPSLHLSHPHPSSSLTIMDIETHGREKMLGQMIGVGEREG